MNMIRPVSDLRNNFADISKTVHETAQPVFLTKNGYGDMVVLSMEAFENLQFGGELQNPDAADRLAVELVDAAESVLTFPYATPAYQPIRPLKHEYRKILVQNYLMFYWVDEEKKLVTVARVVYAKRDYGRLLE